SLPTGGVGRGRAVSSSLESLITLDNGSEGRRGGIVDRVPTGAAVEDLRAGGRIESSRGTRDWPVLRACENDIHRPDIRDSGVLGRDPLIIVDVDEKVADVDLHILAADALHRHLAWSAGKPRRVIDAPDRVVHAAERKRRIDEIAEEQYEIVYRPDDRRLGIDELRLGRRV